MGNFGEGGETPHGDIEEIKISSDDWEKFRAFKERTISSKRNISETVIHSIECGFETEESGDYILNALETYTPDKTVFIRGGASQLPDSIESQLREISAKNNDIDSDFAMQSQYDIRHGQIPICDKDYLSGPYADAVNKILSSGGRVVDISLEIGSQSAINFIKQNASIEFAIEQVYQYIIRACFDKENIPPKIMEKIFPDIPQEKIKMACEQLYLTYSWKNKSFERDTQLREYYDALGLTYARKILEKQATDGDFVICPPYPASKIFSDQNTIKIIEKPEDLFKLNLNN